MSVLSSQKQTKLDLLFLAPLSLFFLLYRLGSGSLASWDEAIYASVAKEVVQSGDWLRLTLDGSLWFDKPPLAIWMTTVFYKLFGVHEFSARLFSALCGVGAVVTTYFFGRELFNRWTGFVGALVDPAGSADCMRYLANINGDVEPDGTPRLDDDDITAFTACLLSGACP